MSKLFVKTFGCTLNKKDTEEIISNTDFTDDLKNIKTCEKILINTCGVKEQTQTKIINFLKKIKSEKILEKNIIIFGCLVDIDKEALEKILPNAHYFKVSQKKEIKKLIAINNKKTKTKKTTSIIIISNGCLGSCTYCAVKIARGNLESKPILKIIDEIKVSIDNGAKEIFLTSQDNACYGQDKGTNLISLLKEILKIKGDFKIRIGMANPQHIKPILKELIKIYKNKKIYKFLHIPIQSGDNKVLKDMNRFYKIEDVFKIVKEFKKEIKNITIATDVIVGFPTEKEEEFKNTIKAIKKIKPLAVNISRFGMRKGIVANKYKDLPGNIKKERSRTLTKLFEKIAYSENKKERNKKYTIIITEKGKNNTSIGKTDNYKSVVLFKTIEIGKKINVKIKNTEKYYLVGEITNPK
jgi:threonylcarbamoyladenosine tRNA methylthiotransferase CDKAL1